MPNRAPQPCVKAVPVYLIVGVLRRKNAVACQLSDLYSLGECPTRCLNKRVKCCGYLNPNS